MCALDSKIYTHGWILRASFNYSSLARTLWAVYFLQYGFLSNSPWDEHERMRSVQLRGCLMNVSDWACMVLVSVSTHGQQHKLHDWKSSCCQSGIREQLQSNFSLFHIYALDLSPTARFWNSGSGDWCANNRQMPFNIKDWPTTTITNYIDTYSD